MKLCGACGQQKPVQEFAWRRERLGQRHNMCRPCQADYRRRHYEANRAKYIRLAGARRARVAEERFAWLVDYLTEHPCVDCGETDVLVLEFDHVRGEKKFNISRGIVDASWDALTSEIDKCEVVCANCHRRRTAQRGSYRRTRV
jgi:hypothetical protein